MPMSVVPVTIYNGYSLRNRHWPVRTLRSHRNLSVDPPRNHNMSAMSLCPRILEDLRNDGAGVFAYVSLICCNDNDISNS